MHLTRFGIPSVAIVAAALIAALALPGVAVAQAADEPIETAKIRFLNGHQHGPADIYVDGEPVTDSLGVAQISDYVEVPAGERLLEAVGSGMSLDEVRGRYDSGVFPDAAEATQKLKAKMAYTAVLNQVDSGVEFKVVADKAKPKPGQAQARVVSMCWACGPMAYGVDGLKKPLAKYLHYPEDKFAGKYVKVKPGELDLIPRLADAKGALTDFEPVSLAPGTSNSLFVVGQDASSIALVPALDAALSGARFMNATREPLAVDVYVDGKKVAKKLQPRQAAAKDVTVLSGDHLVQVVEAGNKSVEGLLSEATIDFPYGPVAVEVAAGDTLEAVPISMVKAAKAKTPQIRFAHIDPEIPAVDIEIEGIDPVLGLTVGESTDYMTLPGDSSYVWIRPSSNPASIYHEMPLELTSGQNFTAYLGGSAAIPTVEFVIVKDPVAKASKQ